MVIFREVESKTILRRYKYRDNWFWCRYGINPYRGCQFACNYCDAITEKYLVHKNVEDFSRIIHAKTNAPELLKKEVKRDVVALGGVTDSYQPAEKKYRVTRAILEILRDNGFPVHIVKVGSSFEGYRYSFRNIEEFLVCCLSDDHNFQKRTAPPA